MEIGYKWIIKKLLKEYFGVFGNDIYIFCYWNFAIREHFDSTKNNETDQ